jgi:hypothetical protein
VLGAVSSYRRLLWAALAAGSIVAILIGVATARRTSAPCAPSPTSSRSHSIFRDDLAREFTLPITLTRVLVFNRYTTESIRAVAGMDVVVGFDRGQPYVVPTELTAKIDRPTG